MPIDEAVERAIVECIQEDILAEFLMKSKAEAKKMSIYEYDEERQRRFDREEGVELGIEAGMELISYMLENGKQEEIQRVIKDKEYRDQLLKECN